MNLALADLAPGPAPHATSFNRAPRRRTTVKELVRYLLENIYLDFQGEISLETVRQFLRSDDSREARQLLQKIIEDKGVDELLLTLADCLKEHLRSGINEDVVREQLQLYSES
jgi:hypothetical protein